MIILCHVLCIKINGNVRSFECCNSVMGKENGDPKLLLFCLRNVLGCRELGHLSICTVTYNPGRVR